MLIQNDHLKVPRQTCVCVCELCSQAIKTSRRVRFPWGCEAFRDCKRGRPTNRITAPPPPAPPAPPAPSTPPCRCEALRNQGLQQQLLEVSHLSGEGGGGPSLSNRPPPLLTINHHHGQCGRKGRPGGRDGGRRLTTGRGFLGIG